MSQFDFALERRLKELDSDLHQRFSDTVFALQQILSNYKLIFPDFTDHTELHSLNIIEFCNQLVANQINKLNADEIYCLLVGCYFHDTGMGISENDFHEFSKQIDFGDYFLTHDKNNYPEIIRSFHNEFSALFIKKYARFFDFPSKEHLFAIAQISRGHRKTNLLDHEEFPLELKVPNGNTICLPYLSALVRLADEIDKRGLNLPRTKWFTNLTTVGNIGCVSIYAALDELLKTKEMENDDQILLLVPESGRFSYGVVLLTVKKNS